MPPTRVANKESDMDMTTGGEMTKGKRATVPKHGKKPENRLWSTFRRGHGAKKDDSDGTINPDASIRVAAVCGSDVLLFAKSRNGVRRLEQTTEYGSHGEAMQVAAEHDEGARRSRITTSSTTSDHVFLPFYQVKVAGFVTDQTNSRERAHGDLRSAAAKPAELWRISEGGEAELLERMTY